MSLSTESDAAGPAEAPVDGLQSSQSRPALLWLAGVLVLGLLVGLGGGLLISQRDSTSTPGDNSVEAGFLRDMMNHHAQAIEMAMIAHANSNTPAIVNIADDIALTQQGQKGYMQAWLRAWNLSPTSSQPVMAWMPDSARSVVNGLMPGMATPEQMAALRQATGKQLDSQFLTLMRQHHLGGIHMAQEAVRLSENADVDWIAQSMVSGQQAEITVFDNLLKQLGSS